MVNAAFGGYGRRCAVARTIPRGPTLNRARPASPTSRPSGVARFTTLTIARTVYRTIPPPYGRGPIPVISVGVSQTSAHPSPPRESGRRSLRARRLIVAGVIALELVLGLALIAAFGGFKPAEKPQPRLVRAGETIDTKRFDIKPLRVWRYDVDPTQNPKWADKGRFLAVELEATVKAKESERFNTELQQGMHLRYPDGHLVKGIDSKTVPQRKGVVYEKDRQYAQLHPDMPRRVFVVYALPKQQKWPSHVEVSFLTWEYTAGFLDPSFDWRPSINDTVAARVDLTVLEAPK